MSTPAPGTAPLRRRFTPAVLLLFAGSGCAALIYEVVWFHLLRLVVGGSAVSLGFLLGSFMGGLGLGSLLLPRLLPARLHPLRVYAALELGIGAIGFAMPTLLPALGRAYAEAAGAGSPLLRGAVCAVALLPPTILMGATLPAIARWLDTTREGLSTMGRFYAANIVGAVAGTLLSGFWLMRVYDSVVASQVAAALNVFVAAVAILLAGRERFVPAPVPSAEGPVRRAWPVYLAIAASGCTALGAQVAWSRLLALLFGASVYTFSAILSVFLVGLGAGSSIGARLSARVRSPMVAFALCQLLLAPALLYSAWMITEVIPAAAPHLVFRDGVYQDPLWRMPYDIARCALAILPGPVLWGMSFPLAIAAAGEGHRDPGRLVGGISALNTAGAIVGALAGALAIELVGGSRQQQQALAAIAAATGLVLLLARARRPVGVVAAVAAAAVVSPSVWSIPPVPPGLIASGRFVEDWNAPLRYLFVREGMNSSVAVTEDDNGIRCFHVCGKVEASSQAIDMRLQRMLGHLPALAHGAPRKVLIVGCGAGVTAGCFVDHPSVERIVLCEIEPNVLDAARGFFAEENRHVLDDPRTEVVFDDARHFLLTTKEKFDVITSDPIHPWVRGAAALYSLDYFALVRQRMEPGAVVTQWVPLYETDEAAVQSQLATFCRAFPGATVWSSDLDGRGYDTVLMAKDGPLTIDVDAIAAYLDRHDVVRAALAEVDVGDAVALLSTFAGRADALEPWLAGAQINDDVGLKLQYLAGLRLDLQRDHQIFAAMRSYLRWPEGLFVGSPELAGELRVRLSR